MKKINHLMIAQAVVIRPIKYLIIHVAYHLLVITVIVDFIIYNVRKKVEWQLLILIRNKIKETEIQIIYQKIVKDVIIS